MSKNQIITQLYEEYKNHKESMKESMAAISAFEGYNKDHQNYQLGYFAAYDEILQDLKIKMREV